MAAQRTMRGILGPLVITTPTLTDEGDYASVDVPEDARTPSVGQAFEAIVYPQLVVIMREQRLNNQGK